MRRRTVDDHRESTAALVTVSCKDHSTAFLDGMWNFFRNKHAVDFNLRSGGRSVLAHRLVLELFLAPGKLPRDGNGENVEPNDDEQFDDGQNLDSLLEFLYRGTVALSYNRLDGLQDLAERLGFHMLVEAVQIARRQPSPRSTLRRRCRIKQITDDNLDHEEEDWKPPAPIRRKPKTTKVKGRGLPEKERNLSEEDGDDCNNQEQSDNRQGASDDAEEDVSPESGDLYKDGLPTSSDPEYDPGGISEAGMASPMSLRSLKRSSMASKHKSKRVPRTHRSCPHCDFQTVKSWCFYSHLKSVHGVNAKGEPTERQLHACCETACDFVGKSKCELKYHAIAKHSAEKPFRCTVEQCAIGFGRKADMVKHVQVSHMGIRPHLCEICGRRCVSTTKLAQHRRTHTGEKPYCCTPCDKSYADRTTFRRHLATHDDDRPFICHICGRAFGRADNLNVHLKKGHRTFTCRLCPYTSGIKGDVGKHMKAAHTESKPYACTDCHFRTGTSQNLERHRRCHTKEKPFVCKICGTAYGDRTTFRRHVQRHLSAEKPYRCQICSHAFGVRYSLNAHMKHVHKTVPVDTSNAMGVPIPEMDTSGVAAAVEMPLLVLGE